MLYLLNYINYVCIYVLYIMYFIMLIHVYILICSREKEDFLKLFKLSSSCIYLSFPSLSFNGLRGSTYIYIYIYIYISSLVKYAYILYIYIYIIYIGKFKDIYY